MYAVSRQDSLKSVFGLQQKGTILCQILNHTHEIS
jgi:hypothetical protein